MKNNQLNDHVSAERLQALLEGDLPQGNVARIEEHLAACARCSAELDAWSVLFDDLGDLSSHRPHQGFADRVMAGVRIPEPLPLAARIRDRLTVSVPRLDLEHIEDGVLQDFLDGILATRQATRVERHLDQCSTCQGSADAWLVVLRQLEGLEHFAPQSGFADRVMARIEIVDRVPLGTRIRQSVARILGGSTPEHVPSGVLQDFVDGILPARALARVEAHIGACMTCTSEVEGWRSIVSRLEKLERFAPASTFADQVMTRVVLPQPAPARIKSLAYAAGRVASVAATAARRLVPRTQEAWAALAGVAVTPVATLGLVLYTVFSHPTLTLNSLASFAWWKVMDLAAGAFEGFSATALQGTQGFGMSSLFETLASAPLMVGGGVLAYSMVSALAMRVLYRNLIMNRSVNGRYAYVSAS